MDFKNPPSKHELVAAIEPQPLHIVVTGQIAVERMIEVCIVESVRNPTSLELERMPFAHKLSIAVAFGILEDASTAAYRALAALRNHVAHELVVTLDRQAVVDVRNTLSADQRRFLSEPTNDEPAALLREIVGALYSELRGTLERRRERRLRAEAYDDITAGYLQTANYGQSWAESRRALERELRARVEAKKAQLGWTYSSPPDEDGPWDPYEFEFISRL